MIVELDLVALTDLSFSSSNRTLGQSETLDYIPGRTLWGSMANLAYRSGMSEQDAFRIFHQGSVRILDAAPAADGGRCYPRPFSWHRPKDAIAAPYSNFANVDMRQSINGKQFKACKAGWLTADAELVDMTRDFSLRTAVDPSGKARDGLLYGLSVLRAGATFWTALSGSKHDVETVRKFLDGKEIRVGRSRNAELGLVKVNARKREIRKLNHTSTSDTKVSFLCVSPCVFRDGKTGAQTFAPSSKQFGLPEPDKWELDVASSFIRTTTIVHFNSKRKRPEAERFAIDRGSVITFCRRDGRSQQLEQVVSFVSNGVGEFTGQGYGEVLVSPKWLTDPEIPHKLFSCNSPQTASEPTDELFVWAKQRADMDRRAIELFRLASEAAISCDIHAGN